MGFLSKWLGLDDPPLTAVEKRQRKGRKKPQYDKGVRTYHKGRQVVYSGKRRRRDKDLPEQLTSDFSGKVRIRGKTVRFLDGKRQ